MKHLIEILLIHLVWTSTYCQDIVRIDSDNGLSKITYVVSKSTNDSYIDLLLSSASLGVEEYRVAKDEVNIKFEETPPFIIFKCNSGNCIERLNHHTSIRRNSFPILLSNDDKQNRIYYSEVTKLFDSKTTLISSSDSPKSTVKTSIDLNPSPSGTYGISVVLNDTLNEEFILDSGASLICINERILEKLIRRKTLRDIDILDKVESVIADGSVIESLLINLRIVEIGDYTFNNVMCIVSKGDAPLLLGQNILKAFGTISIDYDKNKLYIID